jgi:hypothetical protein
MLRTHEEDHLQLSKRKQRDGLHAQFDWSFLTLVAFLLTVAASRDAFAQLPAFSNDSAFPPSIFPAGWHPFPAGATDEVAKTLSSSIPIAEKDIVTRFAAIRIRQLPCYKEGVIIEAEVKPDRRYAWILAEGDALLLNGTSPPLHKFNSTKTLNLEEDASVLDYAALFCSALAAEEGSFRMLHSDASLRPLLGNGGGQINDPRIEAPKVVSRTANHIHVTACILYSCNVFSSNFRISKSGQVEMLDDSPIVADLPISVEKFVDSSARFIGKRRVAAKPVLDIEQNKRSTPAETTPEFATRIAKREAEKVMNSIGGGRELVVNVGNISFDRTSDRYEIDISFSFNGAIFRTNNYQVAGRVTVSPDGDGSNLLANCSE